MASGDSVVCTSFALTLVVLSAVTLTGMCWPRSTEADREVASHLLFCGQRFAGGKDRGGSEVRLFGTSQEVRGKFPNPNVKNWKDPCYQVLYPSALLLPTVSPQRPSAGATGELCTKWLPKTTSDTNSRNSGNLPCSGQSLRVLLLLQPHVLLIQNGTSENHCDLAVSSYCSSILLCLIRSPLTSWL